MPLLNGSVTPRAAAVATAASTALPPAFSTSRPIAEASGSTEVTAPPYPRAVGCLGGVACAGAARAVARRASGTTIPRRRIPPGARSARPGNGVPRAQELAVPGVLLEPHLDPPREQGRAAAERQGRVLHPHLVEQARVGELPHQVTTADEPHVLACRCLDHGGVHGAHVLRREGDPLLRWELAVREDPGGQGEVPAVRVVVEDPPVRRGAEGTGADGRPELAVVHRPVLVDVAAQQPTEGVVRVGDEAVERARRVVDGLHSAPPRRRSQLIGSPSSTSTPSSASIARAPSRRWAE